MKIIGITEVVGASGYKSTEYVAIVSHDELKAVADKAGYNSEMKELKLGEEYNLAAGHNFRRELTDAIRKMEEAYKAFAKVAPIAAQFAGVVANKSEQEVK